MREPTNLDRHTFSPEERTLWISRFRSSGLTQVQFAQQHGLKLKTLRGWLYKQRRRSRSPEGAGRRATSTALQKTTPQEPKFRTTRFREIKAPALWLVARSGEWAAEVTWPSGVTVRLGTGAEAAWIRALLEAVHRVC